VQLSKHQNIFPFVMQTLNLKQILNSNKPKASALLKQTSPHTDIWTKLSMSSQIMHPSLEVFSQKKVFFYKNVPDKNLNIAHTLPPSKLYIEQN